MVVQYMLDMREVLVVLDKSVLKTCSTQVHELLRMFHIKLIAFIVIEHIFTILNKTVFKKIILV